MVRITAIPLRLDDRIACEKRLKELYTAQPRQRRMGLIRGLLRMGLDALDAGVQLPGTEVLETDLAQVASGAPVTRSVAPRQRAQSLPQRALPEPPAPVVVQPEKVSPVVKHQAPAPVKVQLAEDPSTDGVKASGALKGFFSVSNNN